MDYTKLSAKEIERYARNVQPGAWSIDTAQPLATLLGSCVAVCLHDPFMRIGGINHFMLPDGDTSDGAPARYGLHAMELLINELLRSGARRDRLEAKLFGGGRMFDSLSDVGAANADFAEKFLADEGIPVVSRSLRGAGGRRIHYWPVSGRARQRVVTDGAILPPATPPPPSVATGDLELF